MGAPVAKAMLMEEVVHREAVVLPPAAASQEKR